MVDRRNEWVAGPWYFRRFCLVLSWCDLWVGCYWDTAERVLYMAPFPGVVVGYKAGTKGTTTT